MLNAPISYQVNKMTVLRGGNQIEGMTRDPKWNSDPIRVASFETLYRLYQNSV